MSNESPRKQIGRRDMLLRSTAAVAAAGMASSAPIRLAQAQYQRPGHRPATQHRDADDRRHRLERFRLLFGRRRGAGASDAECRSAGQGRCRFHLLVRPSELHGGPRLVPDRAYPDPLGAVDRGCPGRRKPLRKETPTIAEFFQKNGYSTYFSGKWHMGDKPDAYPIEHGFDEMKNFAAYYAGVYSYDDTTKSFIPGSRHTTRSYDQYCITPLSIWTSGKAWPASPQMM